VDDKGGCPGLRTESGWRTAGWAGLPEVNRRAAVRWLAVLASRALAARALAAGPAGTEVAELAGDGGRP